MGSYLYTLTSHQRDNIIQEKIILISDYLFLITVFFDKFKDNSNYKRTVDVINDIYLELFLEANRVHDLFDAVMEYFTLLDDITEFKDEEITNIITNLFDELEYIGEIRLMYYDSFFDYYYEIFETGLLSDSNYEFSEYEPSLTDEIETKMLSLIPKKS